MRQVTRKIITTASLVASASVVAVGAYLFEKGIEAGRESDRIIATIDSAPMEEHDQIANSSLAANEESDALGSYGIIIAGVGAGALGLTGVGIKYPAAQS